MAHITTIVKNLGSRRRIAYLPPHGMTLNHNESVEVTGDLSTILSITSSARLDHMEAEEDAGLVEIKLNFNDKVIIGLNIDGASLTAPALGTPASGTLTNCTGLPVSGVAASTVTALGVGSIELGHASDTTLSRASAGRLAIEGVNVVTISSSDTLTNKTLTSPTLTTPVLGTPSSGNLSNCTALNATQLTSGTIPDARLSVATASQARAATDTAKPLTSSNLNDYGAVQTLTSAATIAWDMSLGVNATVNNSGNNTLGAPTNARAGTSGKLTIVQGLGGSHTLAYNSAWRFAGGTPPTLSTPQGALDVLSWYTRDGLAFLASLEKAFA